MATHLPLRPLLQTLRHSLKIVTRRPSSQLFGHLLECALGQSLLTPGYPLFQSPDLILAGFDETIHIQCSILEGGGRGLRGDCTCIARFGSVIWSGAFVRLVMRVRWVLLALLRTLKRRRALLCHAGRRSLRHLHNLVTELVKWKSAALPVTTHIITRWLPRCEVGAYATAGPPALSVLHGAFKSRLACPTHLTSLYHYFLCVTRKHHAARSYSAATAAR